MISGGLIEAGEPTSHPADFIDVTEEVGGVRRKIRYSDLSDPDLTIGRDEITGKVKRQIVEPENEKTEAEQKSFRTSRRGLAQDDNALMELLQKEGFQRQV